MYAPTVLGIPYLKFGLHVLRLFANKRYIYSHKVTQLKPRLQR
jgi:hypothetical protein